MQYTYCYDSPLGRITLASDGEKLSGLWFEGQKYYGGTLSGENGYVKVFYSDKRNGIVRDIISAQKNVSFVKKQ